jgi:GTP cyclohydrolase I
MEEMYKKLMETVGENVEREGLKKTPARAFQAFKYLTNGYTQDIAQIINAIKQLITK